VILVDTSVWIDHLRAGDDALAGLLESERVLTHPFVIGEIALGALRERDRILQALHDLPRASGATDAEVIELVEHNRLFGSGIGYIDAHLLASVRITPGARLWTRDRTLAGVALRLGVAANLPH
jgi:predicted nucleic acid-binding protein